MRPRHRLALVVLLLASGAASAGLAGPPAAPPAETARVAHVIDGDTVALASGALVRYIGIDAPEVRRRVGGGWKLDPEPYALAATRANRELVEGRTVRLDYDRQRTDRYGRTLAYVYVGNVFVNAYLVRRGLARAVSYPPNLRHETELTRAESRARREGRGIWAPTEAPPPDAD